MSIRYSLAATAAVLLTSFAGAPATAADNGALIVESCAKSKSVVFRTKGLPGKSKNVERRIVEAERPCAGDTGKGLMLVSFIDAPGGEALLEGKASRAIRQLTGHDPSEDRTLVLNNLCVAHTALRQWEDAKAFCDAAVTAAARDQAEHARWPGERRRLASQVAAAVYSNRAVMNWLSENALAAQGDYAKAKSIAPKAAFVQRNGELSARLPARLDVHLPVG